MNVTGSGELFQFSDKIVRETFLGKSKLDKLIQNQLFNITSITHRQHAKCSKRKHSFLVNTLEFCLKCKPAETAQEIF